MMTRAEEEVVDEVALAISIYVRWARRAQHDATRAKVIGWSGVHDFHKTKRDCFMLAARWLHERSKSLPHVP